MTDPAPSSDRMVSRLAPGPRGGTRRPPVPVAAKIPVRPPFRIVIPAADGTVLLEMTEENGRLKVTGEESRWDEAARRFLHQMMQWSGQVGIRWQDEVLKSVGEK